jgi:hypothetical protein
MSYPVSIEDIMTYQAQITNEMFVPPRTIQYFEREEYNSQLSESIISQLLVVMLLLVGIYMDALISEIYHFNCVSIKKYLNILIIFKFVSLFY